VERRNAVRVRGGLLYSPPPPAVLERQLGRQLRCHSAPTRCSRANRRSWESGCARFSLLLAHARVQSRAVGRQVTFDADAVNPTRAEVALHKAAMPKYSLVNDTQRRERVRAQLCIPLTIR
jgi:hypothetical protein